MAGHSELLGQRWPGGPFGFELFYELLVLFELVFEHVRGVESLDMDVGIALLTENGIPVRLISSLDLVSLIEDVVRFQAVLLASLGSGILGSGW